MAHSRERERSLCTALSLFYEIRFKRNKFYCATSAPPPLLSTPAESSAPTRARALDTLPTKEHGPRNLQTDFYEYRES